MSKTIKLNNGNEIPIVGLGTYKSPTGKVQEAIKYAIDAGYRHFDCAWFYGNESEIGLALKEVFAKGSVQREDIFITSKLWNNFHKKDKVVQKIKETLSQLQLDYLDLYLVHWPFAFKEHASLWPIGEGNAAYSDVDYLETWEGMEECFTQGLAKNIGISNFNTEQIDRLLKNCTVKPVVNQVEVNLNLNQKKLIKFCKDREIIITGYSPLRHSDEIAMSPIDDPNVVKIGRKYNKTSAQIILNYLVSLGICVIPKSVTKSRIIENIDIFNFKLDDEDVAYLDSLNKNIRICGLPMFSDHKYFPFKLEF